MGWLVMGHLSIYTGDLFIGTRSMWHDVPSGCVYISLSFEDSIPYDAYNSGYEKAEEWLWVQIKKMYDKATLNGDYITHLVITGFFDLCDWRCQKEGLLFICNKLKGYAPQINVFVFSNSFILCENYKKHLKDVVYD